MDQATRRRFQVAAHRSAVLIRARSNVGHIEFATGDVRGRIEVDLDAEGAIVGSGPYATVEILMDTLESGNALYDAELRRKIEARRFPRATVQLLSVEPIAGTDRYQLRGELNMHGVTRTITGTVTVAVSQAETIVVTGEHVFDIRDFDLPPPTTTMLKIYPDVRVQMHLEAHTEALPPGAL